SKIHLADKLGLVKETKTLAKKLSERYNTGELKVSGLALTTRVKGFGFYEPLKQARIDKGKKIILYAELQGLDHQNTE
ncbi:MAG: hypothetical protein HQL31_10225, partial [Planctomycetes bacterium]|nr:hypothetical protein [Planctomycetota bacterium]